MSFLSGKADLADFISGLGGWYNKNGKPVKFGDPGVGAYYSDIYRDFLEFKKRTKGVIYQHKRIKEVTQFNQQFIEEHCPSFKIIEQTLYAYDKRTKTSQRALTTYTYNYWGKEYTAKELKKKGGVFITVEIHFDNLLELLPYFPYVVVCAACDKDSQHIVIANEPYPEEQYESGLQHGFEHSRDYYTHKLAEYTREITLRYFNPEGREVFEDVEFELEECKEGDTPRYIAWLSWQIDTNFNVEWISDKVHWTSPKVIDAEQGIIEMSKEDFTNFIGSKVMVKYVRYEEPPLWIK